MFFAPKKDKVLESVSYNNYREVTICPVPESIIMLTLGLKRKRKPNEKKKPRKKHCCQIFPQRERKSSGC